MVLCSEDVLIPFICGCDAAIDGCAVCCLDRCWPRVLHNQKQHHCQFQTQALLLLLKTQQKAKHNSIQKYWEATFHLFMLLQFTCYFTSSMIFRRLLMGSIDEAGCEQREAQSIKRWQNTLVKCSLLSFTRNTHGIPHLRSHIVEVCQYKYDV